ncbi:protein of unknown function [Methylocella tundrae]|uniref:Uncharacterized protein n=1 Tax=Methylocella tundrae TaxID=227605 RepID=A0A4U8Z522_METTU|nr:protein of unknown function [Methylocella tundrae]
MRSIPLGGATPNVEPQSAGRSVTCMSGATKWGASLDASSHYEKF